MALQLAGRRSVLLLDRKTTFGPQIGESLHPDGHRLLAELGLLRSMNDQGHAAYHANRSVWGSDRPVDMDFLRHPDGAGWHLDRARFDLWLRDNAVARGATIATGARINRIARDAGQWRIEFSDRMGCHEVGASIIVDGGGRKSPIARSLGVRRRPAPCDRLACGWVHLKGTGDHGSGLTVVEATSQGWWYTAPLPEGGRVLAFHTDRDLPAAQIAYDFSGLPGHARATTLEISRTLVGEGDPTIVAKGYTAANGSFLERSAGECWLAVGDAALATDPIAARGLLHALYTGAAAASAIERAHSGQPNAFDTYAGTVADLIREYERLWRFGYAQEKRFASSAFWQRRMLP